MIPDKIALEFRNAAAVLVLLLAGIGALSVVGLLLKLVVA